MRIAFRCGHVEMGKIAERATGESNKNSQGHDLSRRLFSMRMDEIHVVPQLVEGPRLRLVQKPLAVGPARAPVPLRSTPIPFFGLSNVLSFLRDRRRSLLVSTLR